MRSEAPAKPRSRALSTRYERHVEDIIVLTSGISSATNARGCKILRVERRTEGDEDHAIDSIPLGFIVVFVTLHQTSVPA